MYSKTPDRSRTENEQIELNEPPPEPPPGSAAATAFAMASLMNHIESPPADNDLPDDYWDTFKEDLKEGRL